MRVINPEIFKKRLIDELSIAGYHLDKEVQNAIEKARASESNERASEILSMLLENAEIAQEGNFPLCQDTGLAVFYLRCGRGVSYNNLDIEQIINESVREAYQINNYRQSVVRDPVKRVNTKDNAPAIIHYELVEGEELEISFMLKGGGSENMSALKMLTPADGLAGIRQFVLDTIKTSQGNACPPLVVGIGIGGNFETVAWLAKKSLFRKADESNPDHFWAAEEEYLLNEINKLDIGPMGLCGDTTALKVNIETMPCHIASLPVAVNLECHAHRMRYVRF